MDEQQIIRRAIEYARSHKKEIVNKYTNKNLYKSDIKPVSIFMAGPPGAGKTEHSIGLLKLFNQKIPEFIRIDPDDLRKDFSEYSGSNSRLFQSAISIWVDAIHDALLNNAQSFILDGTFSDYDRAFKNVSRSINRNRAVIILFIYQEPVVAWDFTKAREKVEGRNISKDVFIKHYVNSIDTCVRIRNQFGNNVSIYLVKKNFNNETVEKIQQIDPGDSIEKYIEIRYDAEKLNRLLT